MWRDELADGSSGRTAQAGALKEGWIVRGQMRQSGVAKADGNAAEVGRVRSVGDGDTETTRR